MKNKASLAVSFIFTSALTVGLLICIATSFSISFNLSTLIFSSVAFSAVVSLVSEFVKANSKYTATVIVLQIVYVLTLFISRDTVIKQLEYTVNKILAIYSQYMSVPSSVSFASNSNGVSTKDATVLLVFIAFIVSELIAISLVRFKRIIVPVIVSIIILIPCFLMVNTPPSLSPLICVLSILFALYLTAFIRRKIPSFGGFISAVIALLMAVIITIISVLCPLEGYKRFEWQENLLDYAQKITEGNGINSQNNTLISLLGNFKSNLKERENLKNLGDFKLTGDEIMDVKAQTNGRLYLKGMSYADYEDNGWSILSDEEAGKYPQNFDISSLTRSKSNKTESVNIRTKNKENLIFVPYYPTSDFSFIEVGDVFVKNNSGLKNYTIAYYSADNLYRKEGSKADDYEAFVYETYTKLPDSTKDSLLEIAKDNNIDNLDVDSTASAVKSLVSNCAVYSVSPDKMPNIEEDFAVWFIESANSGYCVHFATAAATMLRALGVPARYVTGYCASADADKWVTVTSDDAHAWVEYYKDSVGWIPLDATPSVSSTQTVQNSETATTQSTTSVTVSTTVPSTTTNVTEPKSNNITTNKSEFNFTIPTIIIAVVLLIIAVILLRTAIINKSRQKKFSSGKINSRIIYMYRYISLLTAYTKNVIPDTITDIANEAKFSNHTMSEKEVAILRKFVNEERKELYGYSPKLKKLYYRFIKVL